LASTATAEQLSNLDAHKTLVSVWLAAPASQRDIFHTHCTEWLIELTCRTGGWPREHAGLHETWGCTTDQLQWTLLPHPRRMRKRRSNLHKEHWDPGVEEWTPHDLETRPGITCISSNPCSCSATTSDSAKKSILAASYHANIFPTARTISQDGSLTGSVSLGLQELID